MGAGTIRLRPVLMTALAMIIGMVPMALGLGEAGEQNAPLGRAVIGGLIMATFATLFIVPIFYTLLRRKPPTLHYARYALRRGSRRCGRCRRAAVRRTACMARRSRFASFLLYVAGIVLVGGAALGGLRMWHDKDMRSSASREALADVMARGPVVQVATVTQGPKERLIQLLGDTRPYQAATLYSKTSGYRDRDHGGSRRHGEDATTCWRRSLRWRPTSNTKARCVTCRTSSATGSGRRTWCVHGWTSQQDADQAQTNYTMAIANVAQLATMKSYEQIRAPFDGVVTAALRRYRHAGAEFRPPTRSATSRW